MIQTSHLPIGFGVLQKRIIQNMQKYQDRIIPPNPSHSPKTKPIKTLSYRQQAIKLKTMNKQKEKHSWKKDGLGINPLWYLILLSVSFVLILIGTFFDYPLSKAIVDTKSPVGGFVETLGVSFSFTMILLGGVSLFKALFPSKKKSLKALAVLILILTFSLSVYYISHHIINNRSRDVTYGITFQPLVSYLISLAISLFFIALYFYAIKSQDRKYLILMGVLILGLMLTQTLVIELLKRLACRPRYRYLIDSTLNTKGETFSPIYLFKPFKFHDDYHKSFPSGHTATAAVTLLLPLLSKVLRHPFKHSDLALFLISLIYTVFVAFFRIQYGAHFLSDVSTGLFITTAFLLLYLTIANRIYAKKKKKKKKKNELKQA